ncbi:MAG: GNAT family N-acetyltransferase [Paracoccaceae bacterium]
MDLYPETLTVSDRIILRPLVAYDAAAIAAGLSDWAVTQWLTVVPFPYALSDAAWFLANDVSRGAMGIVVDGAFAGVIQIGTRDVLGYWLARPYHGQGIMTRAAAALIAAHFSGGARVVASGYHVGNTGSRNVLHKLGFHVTGHSLVPTARGDQVVIRRMALTADAWQGRRLSSSDGQTLTEHEGVHVSH